jgi:hypothetical protein
VDKFVTKSPLFLALVPTHPIVNFTVERMKERLAVKAQGIEDKRRDFLTRCFEAQSKYPDLVTDRIIRMYNIDNVFAGSDTTGRSFRSVSITDDGLITSWLADCNRALLLSDEVPRLYEKGCGRNRPSGQSWQFERVCYLERVKQLAILTGMHQGSSEYVGYPIQVARVQALSVPPF